MVIKNEVPSTPFQKHVRRRVFGDAASTMFTSITDEQIRFSLVMDYRELEKSLEASNWKCVHVISGSILEAIVVDFLISCGIDKKRNVDALTITLSDGLTILKQEHALTDE